MAKTIVALNGSARKKGNSAALLDAFLEGLRQVIPDAEIERVDLFDLDYKGCRGCHGCELKDRRERSCVQRDGATELLMHMRAADGLVFSSPVFFWELTAQLRALLERYIYPGMLYHHQEIEGIYNMFQPEYVSDSSFTPHAETIKHMLKGFLRNVNFSQLIINQTLTYDGETAKKFEGYSESNAAAQQAVHDKRWPQDLERAREAGKAFAERIMGSAKA